MITKTFVPGQSDVDVRNLTDSMKQLETCVNIDTDDPYAAIGALMADHHKGYSCPIGGVVAYTDYVSPSAVGYDIGCGNSAVKLNVQYDDIKNDLPNIMNEITKRISFGVGRSRAGMLVHPLFDEIARFDDKNVAALAHKAEQQLGTVGSGNHYVDLFRDMETNHVWIGNHFGSRGFGHTVASGFMALAAGLQFNERVKEKEIDSPPILIPAQSELGQTYWAAMNLAGRYASAGRRWVINTIVSDIFNHCQTLDFVDNNHNLAWQERHFDRMYFVHRKGATPAFPGQRGFIGGSMSHPAVIVQGNASVESERAMYSTIHGAGRVMSRMEAKGKIAKDGTVKRVGKIDWAAAKADMRAKNIELRGAGPDEAPGVYKNLDAVLAAHAETITVLHRLMPIGVAMAGDEFDPYKD